ncbi:MAG: shikimate kinase [Candidatus Omnitrophica bacterium]|nr:shikimate kinase [Candidatus Omnitrophota bacterium]
MRNIYLVGMMGSGKSETGSALAEILGMKAVDMDDLIVQEERRSLNEIFEQKGEAYFRELESRILGQISIKKNQVIATGGGSVIRDDNRHVMLQTGKVIYLKSSLDVLWDRLQGMKDRPLLKTADPKVVLERIFEERRKYYECFEDAVDTDFKTPEDVAREIAATLED